jgi:hypothetical protein
MAPKLIFLIFSGSKKKEPRYACLSEALTENMDRGLLLCPTLPAQRAVCQPHQVKVSSQGVMPSE